MLALRELSEVLAITGEQIVPIPHLPVWVMGVHNWRGEVLWMLDLPLLLDLPPWQESLGKRGRGLVLRGPHNSRSDRRRSTVGLAVSEVDELTYCDPCNIETAAATSSTYPKLDSFLQGYWQPPTPEPAIAVLDGTKIFGCLPAADEF